MESVKELKKLWELKLKETLEKRNNNFKETKSKSIVALNSKNESKRLSLTETEHKPIINKLATFHEINNNQSNTNSEEIYFHSDIETDRIVKKLKAKFDNVDESFVKVV
jgi:hypothetical protein